jgi:hypothetical protein
MTSESASISSVRSAIERAKLHHIDVKSAETYLHLLQQKQECTRELEVSIQQKKEERLASAIESAKRLAIDTSSAEVLLREIILK